MISSRVSELLARNLKQLRARTDRLMLVILLSQWALAILVALVIPSYTLAGKVRSVHLHVQVALLLGGTLNSLPTFLILRHPGEWYTRQAVTVSQMLWSGLLIHLSGGRIETHFHIFVSLAFLAFYRDWRLLPTATLVVAADHLLRGALLQESVYGSMTPQWGRSLEHGFWLVFEDLGLFFGCRRGLDERRRMIEREVDLADLNATLEQRVAARTTQLSEADHELHQSLDALCSAQHQLVIASRQAGMAEVATTVLHNVGNVLNSVNISAGQVIELVRASKSSNLARAVQMLREQPDPGAFFAKDPRGRRMPEYLCAAVSAVQREQGTMTEELMSLQRSIDHIKAIVRTQQADARTGGVLERLDLRQLLEDAIRFHAASPERGRWELVREFEDLPLLKIDRHKVFQIVMNLLTNARHAVLGLREGPFAQRRVTVRLRRREPDWVAIEVADTGYGIPQENLARIFDLGFTTKDDGHGFGLHGSAYAAIEMGGALTAHSDGPGKGAVFTLLLPCRAADTPPGIGPHLLPAAQVQGPAVRQ